MSALVAGRALDAEVAEKVMGGRWDNNALFSHVELETGWLLAVRDDSALGFYVYEDALPYYSSDIDSAFLVVEKMRADGWRFELMASEANAASATGFAFGEAACRAEFSKWAMRFVSLQRVEHHARNASTVPLAICLAALASLRASLSSGTQPDEVKT